MNVGGFLEGLCDENPFNTTCKMKANFYEAPNKFETYSVVVLYL